MCRLMAAVVLAGTFLGIAIAEKGGTGVVLGKGLQGSTPVEPLGNQAAVIAILSDTSLVPHSEAAPSEPYALGELLKAAGYVVRYLDRFNLADPADFNSDNVDLLVLPYGPAFPQEAVENLKSFLEDGGKLLTTGGYAFDDLAEPLNTRTGKAADLLEVPEDRIAMFDAGYRLKDVAYVRASPNQYVIDPRTEMRASLRGYAAVGMFGNNDPVFALPLARWVPVLSSYDEYGRSRGTVGAIAYNFAGPYAGSAWAFFGVTSHDLFSWPEMQRALPGIVESLLRSTFLNGLQTDYASYRDGEEVLVSVQVRNSGYKARPLVARLRIFPAADETTVLFDHTEEIDVPSGSFRFVSAGWAPARFDYDLYRVKVDLFEKDSARQIDSMEVGFTAWREDTIAAGPRIRFRNNFFQVNDIPKLQFAAKSPGFLFSSPLEEPLRWYQEMVQMRDMGLDQFEVIHVSPFAQDFENPDERLLRKLDALVVLAQKVGIGIKFSLFDWVDVAPPAAELEQQANWARHLASRYASVPGIIFDLQGDIPLDFDRVEIRSLWNEFLQTKYGSPRERAMAWGEDPDLAAVEVDLPEADHVRDGASNSNWLDRREADLAEFRTWLFVRWSSTLRAAIKAVSPDVPIGAEFYSPTSFGVNIDQRSGSAVLDFTGIGYYASLGEYPETLALTDMRVSGKSLGINEFGVKTHPAWTGQLTWRDYQQAVDYFLGLIHSTFGLGASVVLSWDWKDMIEAVFPWGLNYPGDLVPKEVGYAYRNAAFLFHSFSPLYVPTEIYVVMPTEHRKGDPSWYMTVNHMVTTSIRRLQNLHVSFGVIDENELDAIPKTAKLLIYPCPWILSDETFSQLERFVDEGGILYVSGNLTYDPDRRRQYPDRLLRLAGVELVAERYAPLTPTTAPAVTASPTPVGRTLGLTQPLTAYPAVEVSLVGATALMVDNDGSPITVLHEKGKGRVVFTSDPAEFIRRPAVLSKAVDELYQLLLKLAQVRPIPVTGIGPGLDVYTLPTLSGHQVFVFVNRGQQDYDRVVIGTEATTSGLSSPARPISLGVARGKTGVAIVDPEGRLVAVESTGDVYVGDELVIGIEGHSAVISLDGRALGESEGILLVPFLPGKVSLAGTVSTQWGDLQGGCWRTFRTERDPGEKSTLLSETVVSIRPSDALRTLALIARNGKEQEVVMQFNRYMEVGVLWQ